MTDLLATIVAARRLPPEPVATDALVHLCVTSKAAASVMADLLAEVCPGASTTGLTFTGQDINPETEGRPDLIGSDSMGTRLVVEAKFDAELTQAQVSGAYVDKLNPSVPGALVFLVPQDRMRNVWRTISVTPGGSPTALVLSAEAVDAGVGAMALGSTGHVLAVLSWESLLGRLEAAMGKFADSAGAAELAQIRGLVRWRTSVGWTPLVPDDLPQRVGRQLDAITDVLKAVCRRSTASKMSSGTADGGFGRRISTPSGKTIWVGIWHHWWDTFGPGPAWAQVLVKTPQETSLTSEALAAADIEHHARPHHTDVLIPLHLTLGAEQGVVEEDVFDQVSAIIAAVDGLSVEVVADDAPADDL